MSADRIDAVTQLARRLFHGAKVHEVLIREPAASPPVVEVSASGQRAESATAEELRKRMVAAGLFGDSVRVHLDWWASA